MEQETRPSVSQRIDGKWLIVHDHASAPSREASSPASTLVPDPVLIFVLAMRWRRIVALSK